MVNPHQIQIKKRIYLDLMSGIIKAIGGGGVIGIFLFSNTIVDYEFRSLIIFSVSILVVTIMTIILAIRLIWKYFYLKSIQYTLDKKNIIFKGGIISRFEKIIPCSKIQHLIIYESFWQRIFGLSSISIETAREGMDINYRKQRGTIKPTGPFIPDLNNNDAKKLKNKIMDVVNKYNSHSGI